MKNTLTNEQLIAKAKQWVKELCEHKSQPSGMRWVRASERLPEDGITKNMKWFNGTSWQPCTGVYSQDRNRIMLCSGLKPVKNFKNIMWLDESSPAGAAEGASEGMAEALRQISEMSDPGSPELAIVRMKQIASKALPPGVEDGSGWVKGGKEYIVCAAIQYFVDDKEVIVCGLRHNNCIGTYYDLTGKQTNSELEQGFLTSKGRFVNRIEAGEIALSCGQIKEMKCYGGKMLDSSDLYHSSPLPTPLGVEDNQTKKQ